MIPRYETDAQGMKDSTRYEKCAQGMKNVLKVYNSRQKLHFGVLRYETRVFLKNSGFSYLYGSVSYLCGYEKNCCFSLMTGRRVKAWQPDSRSTVKAGKIWPRVPHSLYLSLASAGSGSFLLLPSEFRVSSWI